MNPYMEKYPVRLNVRMQEELRDEAQSMAHKLGISTSALFRLAMKNLIERKQNI
tara:strand:+ start:4078 stop:4239 length:162 start_codon:yes stop_codon:yes gene_type:complete